MNAPLPYHVRALVAENVHFAYCGVKQLNLDIHQELIVDLFAGGGGNSFGIEMATGRRVDIAINHSESALSLHAVNHPETLHLREDIRDVDPRVATGGRPVGLLHLSPDCRDHSQAKGGQPRSKEIRGLTWQGLKWAGRVMPRACTLENVKQILSWSPLVAKRDKATGRVIRIDGSVAAPGEQVPLREQFLVPDKKREGLYWRRFVAALRNMGYDVDWRILCAADYGVPTKRERLFMVARRDGKPIVWPEATHTKNGEDGKPRWVGAETIIDWTLPCNSIFGRKKPLADATLRRIAKGIDRYVLNNPTPFVVPHAVAGNDVLNPSIIPIAHYNSRDTAHDAAEPLRTITAATKGGEFALMAPVVVEAAHGDGQPGRAQRWGKGAHAPTDPLGTITATGSGGKGIAVAYLAQHNGGFNDTPGHALTDPLSTITNRGTQQQLVLAQLATLRRNSVGQAAEDPLSTLTASGLHHGVVKTLVVDAEHSGLTPEQLEGATRTYAFLMRYYGEGGQWSDLRDPLPTLTTRDRMALVTVTVQGKCYVLVDIAFRMLSAAEMFAANGFPPSYTIDKGHDGRLFTKTEQVRMVGNSVCPAIPKALVEANFPDLCLGKMRGRTKRAA